MIGYIGSVLMVIFSFSMQIPFALMGLGFLTLQALKLKAWNLVILNIVSAAGFCCQLF